MAQSKRENSKVKKVSLQQQKTLKGGLYEETFETMVVPVLVSVALVFSGLRYDKLFPPEADLFSRFIFVYGPIVLSVIIILISLTTLISYTNISIVLMPKGIKFKQGRKEFESTWQSLIYSPSRKKGIYRTIILSDGKTVAQVNSSFFPKFQLLVSIIEVAKAQFRSGEYNL